MVNSTLRNFILIRSNFLLSLTLSACIIFSVPSSLESNTTVLHKNLWETLEPGLELGSFVPAKKSSFGDSVVRVLRIDLKHFEFRLLNASAQSQNERKSVKA